MSSRHDYDPDGVDPRGPRMTGGVGEILAAVDQTTFDLRRQRIASDAALATLGKLYADISTTSEETLRDRPALWKLRARLLDADAALARLDGLMYGGTK